MHIAASGLITRGADANAGADAATDDDEGVATSATRVLYPIHARTGVNRSASGRSSQSPHALAWACPMRK
jgi:hypothetical protein